jgi:Fe-S-cluster containining protein
MINIKSPCAYLTETGMCGCYDIRPFDCRLFPFDLIKEEGKFYWVIWDVDCPIIKEERHKFNDYLHEHERMLIPKIKKYLEAFNEWEDAEYKEKFAYEILRELRV